MKKSNLTKAAAIALSASVLAQPITANANPTVDEVLEDVFDDLESGEKITPGEVIIENKDYPIEIKSVLEYQTDLEVGDIVSVFGFGNSACDGSGVESKVYAHETLVVVGIKSDAPYPYALVEIKEDGSLSEVVGWFPARSIRSRIVEAHTIDYADVLRTIVPKDDKKVSTEEPMDWITGNKYYELGEDYAVKAEYIWPEPNFEYDHKFTTEYYNYLQMCEFYVGDEIYYGLYDWENGTVYFQFVGRDKVAEDVKKLENRYNIISN